ncbi:sensor histidine kinase [Gracilibacillus alcaliphilus]|uniref:sensor histidine kinase n=1 Tax=Gracilibacillus alcaliphilus TaxID=1401441 RepID=UPI0019566C0C|nr:sensor histidine kinase [Gracilibacillus alcaliphilus]MBM7677195.1 two-component system sensor histidine kinase YesM [Gracilibacillus alcaliphilus]
MQLIRNSLKWKSIIIFLLLVTIPSSLIGSIVIYQSNNIVKQQVMNTTQWNLNNMEAKLTDVIEEVEEISRYIIYSNEFRDFMTHPAITSSDYTVLNRLRSNLNGFFVFHQSEKDYFHSVQIKGQNDQVLSAGEIVDADESAWEVHASELKGNILWSEPYSLYNIRKNEEETVITLYRTINHLYDITDPIGLVKFRLDQETLFQHVSTGFVNQQHQAFFIHEKKGDVIGSRNGELFEYEELMDNIKNDGESFQFTSHEENYYAVSRYIDTLDLYIVSVVSEAYILSEMGGIRTSFGYMIVIAILMGLLTFAGFIFFVVRPLLELTRETKRVERGDFKARVPVRSNDEVGQLGFRFNAMVERIQLLIDTKYKLELQNKHSELKALQSQINPHFLYNTLDMIRWTARIEKAPETSKSIEDLANLFRITLSQGKVWIPLSSELKYVQSYMELQRKRLGESFQYYLFKEAGIDDGIVMKLIVEPLVENSFKHGFSSTQVKKVIIIRAYRQADRLLLEVLDNGVGLDVKQAQRLVKGEKIAGKTESFALKNVHDRIVNAFGQGYGIEIDEPVKGAQIRIVLPWMDNEQVWQQVWKGEESYDGVQNSNSR